MVPALVSDAVDAEDALLEAAGVGLLTEDVYSTPSKYTLGTLINSIVLPFSVNSQSSPELRYVCPVEVFSQPPW